METPDAELAKFGDVSVTECDGKLDTGIETEEWGSWFAPYMIRAKLRWDMGFSCRKLPGYPSIVRRRATAEATTHPHAA
jgi:hypothetical protein